MKREDAFYYKNLLMLGFSDNYDEWLDHCLESEDPLSDVVLELFFCGSDAVKTISVLHHYCAEQPFDEAAVCDRLRLFFKDAYYSNRMSKEEISSTMYRLVLNLGDFEDVDLDLWGSMYDMDEFCSLAKDGIISWESFDFAFFSYLDSGTPLNPTLIWSKNTPKKPSLFDKITAIFKS